MFSIDNLITGLQASIMNLKVEKNDDSLLLMRDLYDTDNDEKETITVAKIPLSEMTAVNESLISDYSFKDLVLYTEDYFEVAVQSSDASTLAFRRNDQFTVNEHNYTLQVTKASCEYLQALFCSFSQQIAQDQNTRQNRVRMSFLHENLPKNKFYELFSIYTIKASCPKTHELKEFQQILDAYLFNIAYNYSIVI